MATDDAITMSGETKSYILNTAGLVANIEVVAKFTADVSQVNNQRQRIIDWLSKIEVIGDDTDVIMSLTGRELAGLNFKHTGRPLTEFTSEENNVVNEVRLLLPFGKHPNDTENMLNLERWNQVELNITNDDSATGNFFDIGTYRIRHRELKNPRTAPKSFFRTYQSREWTPISAMDEHTEKLPTRHPIRSIMLSVLPDYVDKATAYTSEAVDILDTIKLTYKGGDVVVYDNNTEDLMRRNVDEMGIAETYGIIGGNDGQFFDTMLGQTLNGSVSPIGWQAIPAAVLLGVGGYTNTRLQLSEHGLDANQPINYTARGAAYGLAYWFDYDPQNDLTGLLDPSAQETVEIRVTSAQREGKVKFVYEQVRAY